MASAGSTIRRATSIRCSADIWWRAITSRPPTTLNKNLLSAGNGDDGLAQAFTFGDTYLFGANIVNAFRLTANRLAGGKTWPDFKDCHCGSAGHRDQGMSTTTPHDSAINVTGGIHGLGAAAAPTRLATFGANDDLSIVHGNHQLAVGANAASWWVNSYSSSYSHGRSRSTARRRGWDWRTS